MALAYICSPFYAKTKREIRRNVAFAIDSAEAVYKCGYLPIVPHTAVSALSGDRQEALRIGKEFLSHCDILVICGDRITDGMREEIEFAHKHNISIFRLSDGGLVGISHQEVKELTKKIGFRA